MSKKNTPKKHYIKEETVKIGRKVERLRKKFLKRNTPKNEQEYKRYKKEHQKMVRRDKNHYYNSKLDNCKGNPGKVWRIINDLLCRDTEKKSVIKRKEVLIHDGKLHVNSKEISNAFNMYYRDVAVEIAKNIKKPINNFEYYLNMSEPAKEKFELVEITEEEVEMTVRNLSNKLSTGPNGISNKTL